MDIKSFLKNIKIFIIDFYNKILNYIHKSKKSSINKKISNPSDEIKVMDCKVKRVTVKKR